VTTATLTTRLSMLIAAAIGTTLAGNALAQDKPADWPSYNRTLAGDRYAPQATVTPATAKQLQQICSYGLGRQSSFQTGPVVIDDTMFVTTDFDTIAIDGATCAVKWRTTETYTAAGPLKVNRGAAVADGRVFRGTQDGRVLAYDASSGKRIWEARIADPALGETVPAALIAWQGLVFAGNAGGDNKGVKGRMYALNATTGAVVWEQYLVPRQADDKSYGRPRRRRQCPPVAGAMPRTCPSRGALPGPAIRWIRHPRRSMYPAEIQRLTSRANCAPGSILMRAHSSRLMPKPAR
jgi:alcohol dehydrogenase (cytochrome c)